MRHAIVLFIMLAGSMMVLGGARLAPDPENLPNLHQPRPQIYTAGQPTDTGFREAASMGVRTVINVLPEKDCWTGEQALVNKARMEYVTLPFSLTDFQVQTVQKFSVLLKKEKKPILIHCYSGNHAGGLWFAYRALVEKAPIAVALKEGRQIGMESELEDSLLKWVTAKRGR